MGMPLESVSILSIIFAVFYVLISSQNGRISKYISTDKMNLLGLAFLMAAYAVFAFAPSFAALAMMTVFVGTGAGLIDTGLNDYMSRHFSSRHMNWMHCFWGMGAAISPIIMAQMMILHGWRMGYAAIAGIQGFAAILVIVSIVKGIWKREVQEEQTQEEKVHCKKCRYLSSGRYGFLQMLTFFLYVGIEGSLGLWISSIMIESRGLPMETVAIFPTAYFASIMAGRFGFGFVAAKLNNMIIIRIGLLMAVAGIVILVFTNSPIGITLAGLGLAPIFPCLMHESSRRFEPDMLSKLVGYQIAAAGAGGAIFALTMGMVLSHISLEALFPIMLGLAVLVTLANEMLAWGLRRA